MNKYLLSITATLAISLIAVPTVNAQDSKSGLLGSWTLSIDESDFGPTPAPDSSRSICRPMVAHTMRRQMTGLRL